MKKERLFYLDFVRAIAVISIVITHFNACFLYLNPPTPEKAVITVMISNIYLGNWGVSLFFIISGAALMYVYGEKCDLKMFYKKRFFNIYPMFWMAYFGAFCYLSCVNKCFPGTGVPKKNFFLTIIGFDGLLAGNINTFYILGEWFLGAIVLLYFFFPILRKIYIKNPALAWGIVLFIYLWFIYAYKGDFNVEKIIFARFPEILFGMSFAHRQTKVNWKIAIGAILILFINEIKQPKYPELLQTTYIGICSFLILVYISYFVKNEICHKIVKSLSKYSYAIFLVHHIIIQRITSKTNMISISHVQSYMLFILICVVIGFLSWILYKIHLFVMNKIVRFIDRINYKKIGCK